MDTTFPHDKPQMLYWNVQSEFDGEATIEITYFTSGISWSADYCGHRQSRTRSTVGFEGFVRVNNNSGEEYEDAQVRLVVGRINLVEKIAELARITPAQVAQLEDAERSQFRNRALRGSLDIAGADTFSAGATVNLSLEAPKEVTKEGLSEYFIYTIEGTETIRNGWSKRMRSLEAAKVPLKIQYRYRAAEYGEQLVRMYLLTNNKESKLGTTPMPDGTWSDLPPKRPDGLSYLVAQNIKYVPIGDKIELNLGVDPEVIFELVKLKTWRDDIWMLIGGTNIFRRVDQPGVEIEINSSVAGWDDRMLFAQRVRNYTKKPIDLEIRRTFGGHVVFRSELEAKNHDFQTVQYTAKVQPGRRTDLLYEIVQHQGHNAKQSNVTIERAAVEP